ncbi:MFS transporter [Tissierella sp.]|uniref:MFS transporter n=1 Tax=Tissierella sp. TaxID=41274 RepID=UPI00285F52BE|nr:MFS transporter [Tissierella sp.]MDR7855505.1 MFS transporter [Tissierella sp.]
MNVSKENKIFTAQFIIVILMALSLFLSVMFLTSGIPANITATTGNAFIGGMMTTFFMIAAIITRPIIGYIIKKVNVKSLNIMTIIILSILIFSLSITNSIALMLFIRVLQGICFGILSTSMATMATNVIPAKRMGEGIGYYGMATSGGTSFAPMIALSILQAFSYKALILTSTALAIATLVLTLLSSNNKKEKRSDVTSDVIEKISFTEYAFDLRALLPCIIVLFFSFTLGGVTSFLKPLGKEAGIEATISLFFLVESIVLLISKAASGIIYDRLGHKVIMYPAAICGIIGLYLLSIVDSTTILLVAAVFYGIAYGFLTPTLQTVAVSRVDKKKHGTANAMYLSFMDLGMAMGSPILGIVAGAQGYRVIYSISIIFIVVLILLYAFTIGHKKSAQL